MEKLRPGDPEQLGPYTLIARLGSGGMGVVFLGSQGSRRVAVKVVRSSFIDDPSLRTRFAREIDTLKKLKSQHVAAYLDSDTEGDLAWHAVEFINGPTLKEQIDQDGPMGPDEWWAFYENLRRALSDIHSFGVTHRDLKPSNIILSDTGLKLIDFGIAHDTEATSITTIGTVAGSPAWLSPEQLEGTDLGPGSDLFSAGSILVYAALGRSPWGSETPTTVPAVFERIRSLDFRLEGLNPEFEPAVKALLQITPASREFVGKTGVDQEAATKGPSRRMTAKPEGMSDSSTDTEHHGLQAKRVIARLGWKRRAALGIGWVLAVTTAIAGVLHIQPASGPVNIYHYEEFSSANPVLGTIYLRLTSGNRPPVPVTLGSRHDVSEPSTRTNIDAVTTWRADEDLVVELISSYSGDELIQAKAEVSALSISGLVRGNPAGISLRVTDQHFEIVVKAPTLDGALVGFQTVLTQEFSRGNEKQAITKCSIRRKAELRDDYSDAMALGLEWIQAYEEAGLDNPGRLPVSTWANRSEDYLSTTSALLSNVERKSPIGIHAVLDEELNRVVSTGEDNLEATQEFIDFNRRIPTTPDYDKRRWQDLAAESGEGPRGFSLDSIQKATQSLCKQEIE
jgi:serine/threonine protein kinase